MKFDMQGIEQGPMLDQFKSDWIDATIHENQIILEDARISQAQLLVINLFCGNDKAYEKADDMIITTNGSAQHELEALFRARGRALAGLLQRSNSNG